MNERPLGEGDVDPGVEVVPSVFEGIGRVGDFGWMIEQDEYEDALFVFNDNEEQFLEHVRDASSTFGCVAGGGNAVIRPYQCRRPPRASGIPTGANGAGYSHLTEEVKAHVDLAVSRIRELLNTGRYRRLFFSAEESGELGTGIFEVDDAVKQYITKSIATLGSPERSS